MASGHEMRVGDVEREATAAELREHYTSGRLTLDELNERLDKAFAAKTRGDLDGLMRDLPSARPHVGSSGLPGAGLPGAGSAGAGSAGAGWRPGSGWDPGPGWRQGAGSSGGPGAGWGTSAGRALGAIITTCVLIGVLIMVGTLGVFGVGAGRPAGVVLLILAFGLLRRLLFRRRRRFVRGCGPRRGRW